MSNRTLHERIVQAVAAYRAGKLSIAELNSAVVHHGRALESMPYSLSKELGDIDYELTMARLAEEEGCVADTNSALSKLDSWLGAVPLKVAGA